MFNDINDGKIADIGNNGVELFKVRVQEGTLYITTAPGVNGNNVAMLLAGKLAENDVGGLTIGKAYEIIKGMNMLEEK